MQPAIQLQLAAVRDDDGLHGAAALRSGLLDGSEGLRPLHNLPEHDVFSVEPGRLRGADEELRAVRVRPCVRHRQHATARVLQLKVLVFECRPIDRLPASPVARSEVAALLYMFSDSMHHLSNQNLSFDLANIRIRVGSGGIRS